MKLRLKEDPREWRKSVWAMAFGLAVLSSLLCWREVIPRPAWLVLLGALGLVSVAAAAVPRWFRGYYRFSMRAGVALSHIVARIVLMAVFFCIVTPLGWLLRLSGKDPLRLKRRQTESYWTEPREPGPLDRLF